MRIRGATTEDAAAISELIRPLAAKYIAHEFSAEGAEHLLRSMTPEAIEGYFRSGYRYHVAEQDGQLVAVVATRDNRHLYHLFVAEPFQRQGLAREMWAVAQRACLEAGGPGGLHRQLVPVRRRPVPEARVRRSRTAGRAERRRLHPDAVSTVPARFL